MTRTLHALFAILGNSSLSEDTTIIESARSAILQHPQRNAQIELQSYLRCWHGVLGCVLFTSRHTDHIFPSDRDETRAARALIDYVLPELD